MDAYMAKHHVKAGLEPCVESWVKQKVPRILNKNDLDPMKPYFNGLSRLKSWDFASMVHLVDMSGTWDPMWTALDIHHNPPPIRCSVRFPTTLWLTYAQFTLGPKFMIIRMLASPDMDAKSQLLSLQGTIKTCFLYSPKSDFYHFYPKKTRRICDES